MNNLIFILIPIFVIISIILLSHVMGFVSAWWTHRDTKMKYTNVIDMFNGVSEVVISKYTGKVKFFTNSRENNFSFSQSYSSYPLYKFPHYVIKVHHIENDIEFDCEANKDGVYRVYKFLYPKTYKFLHELEKDLLDRYNTALKTQTWSGIASEYFIRIDDLVTSYRRQNSLEELNI